MSRKFRIYIYWGLTALFFVSLAVGIFLYENVNILILERKNINVDVTGRCAFVMDADSRKALYEKNAEMRFPPASTSKIMTAVVAIESMGLDREISPSQLVVRVEPTIIGLKPGVKYKLRDLLAAILIKSANDAAFTIAEAVAGSEKEFAVLMNKKAAEIGMINTFYATASGLPTGRKDSQYTTAKDLAILMNYAKRYKVILDNMSRKEAWITGSDGNKICLRTHNRALLMRQDAPWGKTGYTIEAKRTFAGLDPQIRPKIVFGLLQSEALWDDIFTLKDKGLELYEIEHTGFFKALSMWIKEQRSSGKRSGLSRGRKAGN